ncbi:MAG: hypothetical protein WC869_06480 [Phycisphaerae bacterium]|jgi:hypothetical protein
MKPSLNPLTGWKPVYITLACMLVIIIGLFAAGTSTASAKTADDGLVQMLTVVFLGTAIVIALLHVVGRTPPIVTWAEVGYMLLIYAMREMDFHRIYTAEHVTRWKLYTGPFPLKDKIIGGFFVVTALAVFLHLLAVNLRPFLNHLKAKAPYVRYLVIWAILLFGAQMLEKPRIFKGLTERVIEETMEMGAAMMMVFVLLTFPMSIRNIFRRRS